MKRLSHLAALPLFFCALFFLSAPSVYARQNIFVPSDGSLFWLDVLDKGEVYMDDEGNGVQSGFTLNAAECGSMALGLEYWSRLLQDGAQNSAPLRILVVTEDVYDDNASAYSPILQHESVAGKTWLAGALADNWFGESGTGWQDMLGLITIDHAAFFNGQWYDGPMATLPQNGNKSDLASTLLHEMMHALGLAAYVNGAFFGENFSLWEQGLRDIYDRPARPGMQVVPEAAYTGGDEFFVTAGQQSYSGVYFTGAHVQEVLRGARLSFPEDPDVYIYGNYAGTVPGLPVNGWEVHQVEFSHIELQNSLMSHQFYRNWNTLMEAELAVMQDLGFTLDRRAWYGYSIYNSGSCSQMPIPTMPGETVGGLSDSRAPHPGALACTSMAATILSPRRRIFSPKASMPWGSVWTARATL